MSSEIISIKENKAGGGTTMFLGGLEVAKVYFTGDGCKDRVMAAFNKIQQPPYSESPELAHLRTERNEALEKLKRCTDHRCEDRRRIRELEANLVCIKDGTGPVELMEGNPEPFILVRGKIVGYLAQQGGPDEGEKNIAVLRKTFADIQGQVSKVSEPAEAGPTGIIDRSVYGLKERLGIVLALKDSVSAMDEAVRIMLRYIALQDHVKKWDSETTGEFALRIVNTILDSREAKEMVEDLNDRYVVVENQEEEEKPAEPAEPETDDIDIDNTKLKLNGCEIGWIHFACEKCKEKFAAAFARLKKVAADGTLIGQDDSAAADDEKDKTSDANTAKGCVTHAIHTGYATVDNEHIVIEKEKASGLFFVYVVKANKDRQKWNPDGRTEYVGGKTAEDAKEWFDQSPGTFGLKPESKDIDAEIIELVISLCGTTEVTCKTAISPLEFGPDIENVYDISCVDDEMFKIISTVGGLIAYVKTKIVGGGGAV